MAVREAQGPVHAGREIQIVRGDHRRHAFLVHELHKLVENAIGGVGIEIAGGLVRQQDLRLIGDGAGNGHALLLTAGKFRRPMVPALRETKRPQEVLGAGLRVILGKPKDELR